MYTLPAGEALNPIRIFILHDESLPVIKFLTLIHDSRCLWSAVVSSPNVVESGTQSAHFRGLLQHLARVVLAIQHICPKRIFFYLRVRVFHRISCNRKRFCFRNGVSSSCSFGCSFGWTSFPNQYCVVVDQSFSEKFQQFTHGFRHV